MRYFVGLHQVSDARCFDAACISVNRLRSRKSAFAGGDWIMDSGAFSTILTHGGYPHGVEEYAAQINRWKVCGRLLAAVGQDYMCEPSMLRLESADSMAWSYAARKQGRNANDWGETRRFAERIERMPFQLSLFR